MNKWWIFALVLVPLTGYASENTPDAKVNSPDGVIEAQGDLSVVIRQTAETYQSSKSTKAGKLELELSKEETKRVRVRAKAEVKKAKLAAQAANPCLLPWLLRPAECNGFVQEGYTGGVYYGGGGIVVTQGGRPHNHYNGLPPVVRTEGGNH
ncbi:MAG: hypothetical protein ACREGC_03525 [Minisyncoccia bacterium]